MKGLWRQCRILPVIVASGMSLILPVSGQAAGDESPPESEVAPESGTAKISYAEIEDLRELLKRQELQLAAQQEEIDKQRTLLRSIQVQLDRSAAAQIPDRSPEIAEEIDQAAVLDELVRNQPESTKYGEDFAGSIPIPDTDAAVKVGGFVKMSMVSTLDPLGTDDRFVTGLIPVGVASPTTNEREVAVSARQSRLGIEIRDLTSYGPLRAFIEGDFAGTGDTYRLRHAFGQFRQVLAGKTWSTMVDNRVMP